jgi:mannose-6-phosphate isomerase-like protein (cupin superfamily)
MRTFALRWTNGAFPVIVPRETREQGDEPMRRIVVGKDASGRSCVLEASGVKPAEVPGSLRISATALFAIAQSPPPPCDPGTSHYGPRSVEPGHFNIVLIEHAPYDPATEQAPTPELHWRDTIDIVHVLEGGGAMLLGEGEFPLGVGDTIYMPGSDHKFLPGPYGAKLIAFSIGTPPAVRIG